MVGDGAYASLDVFWTLREHVVCVRRQRPCNEATAASWSQSSVSA